MSNPFEDPEGTYLVLVNDENQHSLWPDFVDVPMRLAGGPRTRLAAVLPRPRRDPLERHAAAEPGRVDGRLTAEDG